MPIVYTLIAILFFSFWTPIATYVTQHINLWEFIFWTELVGFILASCILKAMVHKKPVAYKKLGDLSTREKLIFSASGLCRVAAMGCLFTAFSYISVAVAISVYDFWPILALYLAPGLVTKDWSTVTAKEIILSIVACSGLLLLLIPEAQHLTSIPDMGAAERKIAIFLPLIAGGFHATAEVIKRGLVAKLQIEDHPFHSIFIVDINYGLFCLIFATIAVICSHLFFVPQQSVYTWPIIGCILFFSVFTTALGRMSLAAAISRATYNIFALWFFLPILTLFWLWAFDLTTITSEIVLGAAMITIVNLLISAKPDESIAYPATVIALILSSIYCYYFPGIGIEDYFEGVATPLVFYVLIVAFLMDRLIRRDREEETLVVEIIQQIENEGPRSIAKKRDLVQQLSSIVQTNNAKEIDARYQKLRNAGHKCLRHVTDKLDTLTLSRIQGANFGEMLVLSMVGVLVVMTAVVFRPDGWFGDCFAIVLSAAICFIYFTVIDLIIMRGEFFLKMRENGKFYLSSSVMKETRLDLVISVILIMVLIAAMIGVMWSKY